MEYIEEIKIHKNKETQRFRCEVLHREAAHIILRYKAAENGVVGNMTLNKGTVTIAYYWTDRGYVLWRMFHPDGTLAGSLFHICSDVVITRESVRYHDLLIDIWISPEGDVRILDEHELEQCDCAGLLTGDDLDWIQQQQQHVLVYHNEILRDAAAAEQTAINKKVRKT